MPHPDDETEVWSLIKNSTANYKVFAYMTYGEETAYCTVSGFNGGFVASKGEIHPGNTPDNRWSSNCKENRVTSTLNFLNKMATGDASLPAGFSDSQYTTITVPANGVSPQHVDNNIAIGDRTVRVYGSTNNMGNVLFFNMGDGDLTSAEVSWAVQAIKANPASFGIPTNLPFYNALGGYANTAYSGCTLYNHPDHKAIHTSLYSVNFGFTGYQSAGTCRTDPDTVRTKLTTDASWNRAWAVGSTGQRTGHAQKYYGWLDSGVNGWGVGFGTNQNPTRPIMQYQSFWQKF